MVMGTEGLKLLKSYETCSLKAYINSGEKNYTIGWGHSSSDIKKGQTITQAQADAYLKEDLKSFEKIVTNNIKLTLNQNQFDALVDYAYNRGSKGLKQLANNSKTISDLSKNILVYWGTNESAKAGIMKRRKAEKALFDKTSGGSSMNPYSVPGNKVVLKAGMATSSYVKWLQFELNKGGAGLVVDGEYGSKTAAAVKAYQKANGLVVDGIAGPKTIASLKDNAA
jgi:GH24 family phage-related lysozyme (muramidase)